MAAAASRTDAAGVVVTGSRVTRSPTRVPSAVLPEVARWRLPIARDSRAWWVAAKKVAKSGCACDSSSNAAGSRTRSRVSSTAAHR